MQRNDRFYKDFLNSTKAVQVPSSLQISLKSLDFIDIVFLWTHIWTH